MKSKLKSCAKSFIENYLLENGSTFIEIVNIDKGRVVAK